MNGAESLVRTLSSSGIEVCFTNPGTTEMHIVAALDRLPDIRCVLGLFEGVITGAADGYARVTGKPACTLLHLGPGLANGLANLHNAYRARVPMVNIVGQHPIGHLRYDGPLTSDIEALARPYSKWLRTSIGAFEIGRDAAEAVVAACTPPGQIVTLIVPADAAWNEGGQAAKPGSVPKPSEVSSEIVERAASMLRSGLPTAILLAGGGLSGEGLKFAGRIATTTNVKLLAPYPITLLERGAGLPPVERIPYILEQAAAALNGFRQIILAGAKSPVSYFEYPGKNSIPIPNECAVHVLAEDSQDCPRALEALAAAISADQREPLAEKSRRPEIPSGAVTASSVAAAIGALLIENAIVVDESMTSGRALMVETRGAPPHVWLTNTGGSIGIAMPIAIGAAIGCPDRRVLCLSADGSGMSTLQSLWTMAREGLNITTVIFANHEYAVLKREFSGLGAGTPGPRATNLWEIGRPDIDWVSLARGMGVPAHRATSLDIFVRALRQGLEADGPTLIEVPL